MLEVTQQASAVVLGFLSLAQNQHRLLRAGEGVSSSWSVCTSGAHLNFCLTQTALCSISCLNASYSGLYFVIYKVLSNVKFCVFPKTILRGKL